MNTRKLPIILKSVSANVSPVVPIRRIRIGRLALAAALPALVAPVLACLLSLSCATVGHKFQPEKVRDLRIGQTTKSELLGLFGLPYRRGIEDGDSTWTYLHYKYRLFGDHLKTRDLFVRFDNSGRVASYTYNSNMDE